MKLHREQLTAEWKSEFDKECELYVDCAGMGLFSALVLIDTDGQKTMVTQEFEVAAHTRNKGVGTNLMMGAFALAKSYGVTRTEAYIESPAALRIRQKLFGDAMTFKEAPGDAPILPLTTDQAILSLVRNLQLKPASDAAFGFEVISSLSNLDTSSWELPIELNRPGVSWLQ